MWTVRVDVICSQSEVIGGWDRCQVGSAYQQLQQRLDAMVPVQDSMDGIRVVVGLGMEGFTNVVLGISCQRRRLSHGGEGPRSEMGSITCQTVDKVHDLDADCGGRKTLVETASSTQMSMTKEYVLHIRGNVTSCSWFPVFHIFRTPCFSSLILGDDEKVTYIASRHLR